MIALLWMTACSVHTIDVHIDPGQGSVEDVTAIMERRMSAIGARRYDVEADTETVRIAVRPEDQPRLDAILTSHSLSIGWEGAEPFVTDVDPKLLQCVETASGLMWRMKLESYAADTVRYQTEVHGPDTMVFWVDGEVVTSPYVPEPITGGTAMAPLDMSYRDCRVLSAQILGGPLPEGVQAR